MDDADSAALQLVNACNREQLGQLVKLLNLLDSANLHRIRGLVGSQVQFKNDTVAAVPLAGGDDFDFVLSIICEVCREAGIDARGVARAKESSAYPAFRRSVREVHTVINTYATGRGEQRQVYRLAYRHLRAQHRCGIKGLMLRTPLVLMALDEMFPGYYLAGLMPVVVARLTEKKNVKAEKRRSD